MRTFIVHMSEITHYDVVVQVPDDVEPDDLELFIDEEAETQFTQGNSVFTFCEDRGVVDSKEIR